MAKLTIDDIEIEYTGSPNLIDLAKEYGIDIPHFCYHPALSVSGNCRMCLVEVGMPARNRETGAVEKGPDGKDVINYMPKPQPGCYQTLSDGMVIKTTTEKIVQARKGVLEMILANHPLDCPVCDQAGECVLQDYSYQYGFQNSRFSEQKRVYEKKEISDVITPELNRCIHCDRCGRFTEEIAQDMAFTRTWRGNRTELATLPGEKIQHNYQGNMVDICPVGALTLTDFRFKSRVWFLRYGPSICASCGKGCNVVVWYKDEQIYRVKPSYNKDVNSYWMCDHGRLDYKYLNENRRKEHSISGFVCNLDVAMDAAVAILKDFDKVGVVASAAESWESNATVSRFFREVVPTGNVDYRIHEAQIADDHSLRPGELLWAKDPYPNSAGAKKAGLVPKSGGMTAKEMLEHPEKLDVLVVFWDHKLAASPEWTSNLGKARNLIIFSSLETPWDSSAKVVFAIKAHTESAGTFINIDGIAQQFEPVLRQEGNAMDSWKILSGLAEKMGKGFNYKNIQSARAGL